MRKNILDSFEYIDKGFKKRQKNHDVDQRVVDFFERLLKGFKNCELTSLPFTYLDNPSIINQLTSLKDDCDGLYEVYSKYDHFSLYEISPLHTDRSGKIKMMARAMAAQIPALNMCLIGLNLREGYDINDRIMKMWRVVTNLQAENRQ